MPDSQNDRYEMSISLGVLDHLGLNLYSNYSVRHLRGDRQRLGR